MPESRNLPRHVPALDGLRGIAVLAVIAFHLAPYAEPSGAVGGMLVLLTRFGWTGVDLFFVLSGFLITGILYDHRHSDRLFRGFYGRRLVRIFPLYYAFLGLYALMAPFVFAPDQVQALLASLPWHATYLTNFRIAFAEGWASAPLYTSHFWSLAVEEQFYLVWPLLIVLCTRMAPDGWSTRRLLMGVCVGLILISIGLRTFVLADAPLAAYVLLPARMDTLAIGALLALWIRGPRGMASALRMSTPVLLVSALGLVALLSGSLSMESQMTRPQQTLGYTLWGLAFAALLVQAIAVQDGPFARLLSVRPLTETGRISYALYVFHFPVIFVLSHLGAEGWGFGLFSVAVLGLSYGLAVLSWLVLEAPLLKLKRHFPYGTESSPGPKVAAQPTNTLTGNPTPALLN